MHYHTALLSFMLIITTLPFTISQTVAPFPYHDCSQEIVYTGDHTCNNDPTTCCAASGECCAGGCCSYDSTCVFQGTENEACCPLSDKTGCGSNPPPTTVTCPSPAAPSVPCSGADDSWYCHAGCFCLVAIPSGCSCPACVPAGGGSQPSSTYVAAASSSAAISSFAAASDSAADSSTFAAASSTDFASEKSPPDTPTASSTPDISTPTSSQTPTPTSSIPTSTTTVGSTGATSTPTPTGSGIVSLELSTLWCAVLGGLTIGAVVFL